MRRVLVLSLLVAAVTAAPAGARRYVTELPRAGTLVLKVRDGRVTARFSVRLRCNKAPFRRRYKEHGLGADVERRRFRVFSAFFGDTGDGRGASEWLEITGRLRRGRIAGRFEYQSTDSIDPGRPERCRFGPHRFRALPE
jgi:hypothetical protein